MPRAGRGVRRVALVVSCEHGGNRIPAAHRAAFARAGRALASHRGYDPGALELARDFARSLDAPLVYSTTSRLLIELNRSLHHPQLLSPWSRGIPQEELVRRHYRPYRDALERQVAAGLRRAARVVHLSCHSFTPRLAGVVRTADVGLLFDPRRGAEAALCGRWQAALRARAPLRVKRNYPYRGSADGLTTDLRARFGPRYLGLELEVSQKFPRGDLRRWRRLRRVLVESFAEALRYAGA